MPRGSWEQHIVDSLCESKPFGVSFDAAWRAAVLAHPPTEDRTRESGPAIATLFAVGGSYVDHPEVSQLVAFRGFCKEAWNGDHPGLRAFTMEMLIGAGDYSSECGRSRYAA